MRSVGPFATAIAVWGGILAFAWNSPAAPTAFDHARDPVYDDGWQSGDNGGYGFGPWILNNGDFTIRSSTLNNDPPIPTQGGDIDSPGARSWAMRKIRASDFAALATRTLNAPLAVGQTLTIDFDSRSNLNDESGIVLHTAEGQSRFHFFDNAAAYGVIDGTGQHALEPGGFGVNGVHIEFTLASSDSYSIAYNIPGQPVKTYDGVLRGPSGTPIEGVSFYAGGFGDPHAYFNNLQVVPEPTVAVLLALSTLQARRRRR